MSFRLIPVLDVKEGVAVRAVAGDRAHYGPVRSILHPDSDPSSLARAFGQVLGFREVYVADLDAIAGRAANIGLYRSLAASGLALWVDAGVRDIGSLPPLLEGNVSTIVAGLETLGGPDALGAILDRVGPERVVFSLDLRAGVPLVAERADWGGNDPVAIARAALRRGVRRVLLLDLARVGTGRGTGTDSLLTDLRTLEPDPRLEIVVGGGISSMAEVRELRTGGASAVLVGSALHDGRIGMKELGATD